MMKRDQRRAVKIEKELEDHKRQLRRQRAETDASEEQTQSQKLLVNLDPVGAGSNYLLQVAPIASSAEVVSIARTAKIRKAKMMRIKL
jgi:hypothetical protein